MRKIIAQEKRMAMGFYDSLPARADGTLAGWSLDGKYYKDPSFFQQETDKIFMDSWIFAGHISQIPNKGDYFLYELLSESVIIINSGDDGIQAFFNVCRHRGSALCTEKSGSVKALVCPYHAWTYSLSGVLKTKRSMPADFDPASISLHPCAMEIIHGTIWINFSDTPESLNGAKRDLDAPMSMYDFAGMKVAAHKNYPIKANWKVTLENYQECYHCAPSHPEYALSHTLKVSEDKFDALQETMLATMESCGLKHFEIDKQFTHKADGQEQYAYSRYALFKKYKTGSKDGEPVAPLLGKLTGFDHGASDLSIGPFSYMLVYNDHAVVYVFTPTGLNDSQCDIYWLVRSDAVEGKDYDLEKLTWLWHVTTRADERIIVDNQKGIDSKKYQPGPLAKMEYLVDRFASWYLNRLFDVSR